MTKFKDKPDGEPTPLDHHNYALDYGADVFLRYGRVLLHLTPTVDGGVRVSGLDPDDWTGRDEHSFWPKPTETERE